MNSNWVLDINRAMSALTTQITNNMTTMTENVQSMTSENSACLKWEESVGGDGKFYFCFGEGPDLVPGDTCASGWIECDPADWVVDDTQIQADIQADIDRFNNAYEEAVEDDELAAIEDAFAEVPGFQSAEFVDAEDQDAATEEPAEEAQTSRDNNTLPENSQDPNPQSPLGDQATGGETGETTAESSEDDEEFPIITILSIVAVLLLLVCIGVFIYKRRKNAPAEATSTETTATDVGATDDAGDAV
jgi:hypothetical protein